MIYGIIIVVIILIVLYQIGNNIENKKSENSIKNVEFKVQQQKNNHNKTNQNSKWELVQRKSQRWFELGFGDGELFPGYGKLYKRKFKVWYCDVGSKEQKKIQEFNDVYPEQYTPKESEKITGNSVDMERLQNSREYERLFTGLDSKNRKRWYFALIEKNPTWIETESQ